MVLLRTGHVVLTGASSGTSMDHHFCLLRLGARGQWSLYQYLILPDTPSSELMKHLDQTSCGANQIPDILQSHRKSKTCAGHGSDLDDLGCCTRAQLGNLGHGQG